MASLPDLRTAFATCTSLYTEGQSEINKTVADLQELLFTAVSEHRSAIKLTALPPLLADRRQESAE